MTIDPFERRRRSARTVTAVALATVTLVVACFATPVSAEAGHMLSVYRYACNGPDDR